MKHKLYYSNLSLNIKTIGFMLLTVLIASVRMRKRGSLCVCVSVCLCV